MVEQGHKVYDLRFLGIRFKSTGQSVWILCGQYKNQTCLILVTTVTDPLSPLPTNSPVSGFLRPPQTPIYITLCCLRGPATLKPRNLSPRRLGPQQKSPISLISPRMPEEASDQSETQSVYHQQDQS